MQQPPQDQPPPQPPQGQSPAPPQSQQSQPADPWKDSNVLDVAFREYHLLMEGTDKITDRRQTVNTLFVTINALFLTGVGYLLLQSFRSITDSGWFIVGFFSIAILMRFINSTWRKLSESNRKLVDLRIRYLKQLERHLRDGGVFPPVETPLLPEEADVDELTKAGKTWVNRERAAYEKKDGKLTLKAEKEQYKALVDRGIYAVEDVVYTPAAQEGAISFSRAEQHIGRIFGAAYWLAFVMPASAYAGTLVIVHWAVIVKFLGQHGIPL